MKIGSETTVAKKQTNKKFEALPKGEYSVALDRVTEKTAKTSGNTYLELSFKVTEGEHEGRIIWKKFFLEGGYSDKCKDISKQQLNGFLKCVGEPKGLGGIDYDTENLNNFKGKNVVARCQIDPGTNGFADSTKITSFARR